MKNRGIPPIPTIPPIPEIPAAESKPEKEEEDNGEEAVEEDGTSTPRWKKLVDTSSGFWQTSTTKISSSKANVSNKFSSVVLLAKKARPLL